MTTTYEIPEIINVLESTVITTSERVYLYRIVLASDERFVPALATDTIPLQNGPVLNVRSLIIRVRRNLGDPWENWSISNGKIRYVFQGNFPDPNIAYSFIQPEVITVEQMQPAWDRILVTYEFAYDWEEFADMVTASYEDSTDTNAGQLQFEVANVDNQYDPETESDINFNQLIPRSVLNFENWVDIPPLFPLGFSWEYPFIGTEPLPGTVVRWAASHEGAYALRLIAGPANVELFSTPIVRQTGLKIRGNIWSQNINVGATTLYIRIYQFDSDELPIDVGGGMLYTEFSVAIDNTQWYEKIFEMELKEACIYASMSFYINPGDDIAIDDGNLEIFEPLFDYMKSVDFWIGMQNESQDWVYDKVGRYYVDEPAVGISDAMPSLSVTCFSNLGRLNFSNVDLKITADSNWHADVDYIPVAQEDYNFTVWTKTPDANNAFFPLADWDHVLVFGVSQSASSGSSRGIRGMNAIYDFFVETGEWLPDAVNVRANLRKMELSEYTVDYERGWIICKQPMDAIRVSAAYIIPGTNEAEDILNKCFIFKNRQDELILNKNTNLINQAYTSTMAGNEPTLQDVIKSIATDGNGPGLSIDELTDVSMDISGDIGSEEFTLWGEILSAVGDPILMWEGTQFNEAGIPNNNFVKPEEEAGMIPDLVTPNYGGKLFSSIRVIGGSNEVWILGDVTNDFFNGVGFVIDNAQLPSHDGSYTVDTAIYDPIAPPKTIVTTVETIATGTSFTASVFIDHPGVFVEVYEPTIGLWLPWTNIPQLTRLFIDYKAGRLGFYKTEWQSIPNYLNAKIRAFYRYWTIQWTQITANKFEWRIGDGDVATAVEKVRESFLPENYLLWDDKDGKIRGNFITEKADLNISGVNQGLKTFSVRRPTLAVPNNFTSYFTTGRVFRVYDSTGNDGTYTTVSSSFDPILFRTDVIVSEAIPDPTIDGKTVYADFQTRMQFTLNISDSQRDIVTKVVSRGKRPKAPEFPFDAWALWSTPDIGFVGHYGDSWNVGGIPYAGQSLFPLYDDDEQTYASWATNDGIILPREMPLIGIALREIRNINKIVFQQAGAGGEHVAWHFATTLPIYTLEYLDPNRIRSELGEDPIFFIERRAYEITGTEPDPSVWKETGRLLTAKEQEFYRVGYQDFKVKDAAGTTVIYNSLPWDVVSPSTMHFNGGQAFNWLELTDMMEEFGAQYFRIRCVSYGLFRGAPDDFQWNMGSMKFVGDETVYGVAFVRDFLPGPQPQLNDPDNEFFLPSLLKRLHPNPVRALILEEDSSLQNDTDLLYTAREHLREYLKIPVELSIDVVFGFYKKNMTVRVYDEALGKDQNFLINRINYSRQGTEPSINISMTHHP